MSMASAQAFRDKLNQDPALQDAFLDAFDRGPEAVVALSKTSGYDVSEEEFQELLTAPATGRLTPFELRVVDLAERRANGELSSYELELANAGGAPTCITTVVVSPDRGS